MYSIIVSLPPPLPTVYRKVARLLYISKNFMFFFIIFYFLFFYLMMYLFCLHSCCSPGLGCLLNGWWQSLKHITSSCNVWYNHEKYTLNLHFFFFLMLQSSCHKHTTVTGFKKKYFYYFLLVSLNPRARALACPFYRAWVLQIQGIYTCCYQDTVRLFFCVEINPNRDINN